LKCDLAEALDLNINLPTDSKGSAPLLHLAALAILGRVDRLKSYRTSFETGDRLGFVPYITKDFIDRAVVLAEEYAASR